MTRQFHGRIPPEWSTLESTTDEEVLFLAPLEIVSARGRANALFDFEYVWEVYKPPHLRQWGYYNLLVLYQDRLIARIDPRLDRKSNTLFLCGFWLENEDDSRNPELAAAHAKGLIRFAGIHGAQRIHASAVKPAKLRRLLSVRSTKLK